MLRGDRPKAVPPSMRPENKLLLAVRVGVVDRVSAGQGFVVAVAAAGAGWEVFGGADLQSVAAVGALVGAGGDVAAGGNGIGHARIIADLGRHRAGFEGGRMIGGRIRD
jgi:hypothetical protein